MSDQNNVENQTEYKPRRRVPKESTEAKDSPLKPKRKYTKKPKTESKPEPKKRGRKPTKTKVIYGDEEVSKEPIPEEVKTKKENGWAKYAAANEIKHTFKKSDPKQAAKLAKETGGKAYREDLDGDGILDTIIVDMKGNITSINGYSIEPSIQELRNIYFKKVSKKVNKQGNVTYDKKFDDGTKLKTISKKIKDKFKKVYNEALDLARKENKDIKPSEIKKLYKPMLLQNSVERMIMNNLFEIPKKPVEGSENYKSDLEIYNNAMKYKKDMLSKQKTKLDPLINKFTKLIFTDKRIKDFWVETIKNVFLQENKISSDDFKKLILNSIAAVSGSTQPIIDETQEEERIGEFNDVSNKISKIIFY